MFLDHSIVHTQRLANLLLAVINPLLIRMKLESLALEYISVKIALLKGTKVFFKAIF